jgi:hypothetical protein
MSRSLLALLLGLVALTAGIAATLVVVSLARSIL